MPYLVKDKILFLSEASKILSSSIDYNVTLAVIAKLIVTSVADFCIIDIFDGRKLKRLAVRASSPQKQRLANKMYKFLPDPKNKEAIYFTAKKGEATIVPKITKGWLKRVSQIEEERETIVSLGLNSHLFVPLKSRGEIIGVLTLASMDPDFVYSHEDAVLLDEIAVRAGIAVDKARLYQEAKDALQTRDEFLSIASHELKTPLTSILLSIQSVMNKISTIKIDDPEIKEIINVLEVGKKQSQRMSRLINDLLNVSVASTGRLTIEREKINISALIEDVIYNLKMSSKNHKIKIIFDRKNDVIGRWDKIRIEQVMHNLLSNAIKYGKGKPIHVTLSKDKNHAVIKVKDSGLGISKKDQELIFERFRRSTNVKNVAGLGVGLYISNQIILAHKGSLSVVSDYGKGSEFTVRLPLG